MMSGAEAKGYGEVSGRRAGRGAEEGEDMVVEDAAAAMAVRDVPASPASAAAAASDGCGAGDDDGSDETVESARTAGRRGPAPDEDIVEAVIIVLVVLVVFGRQLFVAMNVVVVGCCRDVVVENKQSRRLPLSGLACCT